MKNHNLSQSPDRIRKGLTWHEFIRRHKNIIWATDFFSTEVWTMHGLVTYYILFFINLGSRKVVIAGITEHPRVEWVEQHARNISGFDGAMENAKYLIHDRDTKYTQLFDSILLLVGIKAIKLPILLPNLNAYAERFVLSIKKECLDQFIPIGYKSLQHAIHTYVEYYNKQRPHQGLDNDLLSPTNIKQSSYGEIQCDEELGGIIKHYYRKAV